MQWVCDNDSMSNSSLSDQVGCWDRRSESQYTYSGSINVESEFGLPVRFWEERSIEVTIKLDEII